MHKHRSPASGEKSAIRGYLTQYEFSAVVIFRLMQSRQLNAVAICNQNAGIFDDILLFTDSAIVGYQIKSARYARNFRLETELLKNDLITQIANSWLNIRSSYPAHSIQIQYIFPGFPSIHDNLVGSKQVQGHTHSAAFAEYVNQYTVYTKEHLTNHAKWGPFVTRLRLQSDISEDDFDDMMRSIQLLDSHEIARNEINNFDVYSQRRIQQIKFLIPELAANRHTKSLWTEEELLSELGWSHSEGLRAIHQFPLPSDVQANHAVEAGLLSAIQNNASGYLSLIGHPGSGKSTTLQRAITSSTDCGVVRYLAFIPDERHGLGRAEAADFLNDITFGLGKLGFSTSRFSTEEEQRHQFIRQLNEAQLRFERNGKKTVIVIDGLDHVSREEHPNVTLFSVFPLPNAVPNGVLILLGAQHLNLPGLSSRIVQQASRPHRTVAMRPLPKFAVFEMATKALLPDHVDRDLLYTVSGAHPLAVRYYIQRLADTLDESEANSVMSEDGLGTDISDMYERVWDGLDPNNDARTILALLARADNHISPDELAEAVNEEAVENVLRAAAFLLSGCHEGQLAIFHNSFRIFLASRTRRRFGTDSQAVEHDLNNVLATIANRATRSSGQRWLELRYLARAARKDSVRKLVTPELFRQQLAEFRPPKDIYTDLRLAYDALFGHIDLLKFMQLILAEKEIDYRVETLTQIDLVQLHLTMKKDRHAFAMAMASADGTPGTYELVDRLVASNDLVRARQLFDAIEPVEHFFGVDNHHLYSPDFSDVCRWVERAFHFRSLDNIIGMVSRFPTVDDRHQRVRPYLLYLLGRGIVIDDPRRDIRNLCRILDLHEEDELKLLVQGLVCAGETKNLPRVRELLDRIRPNARELDDECSQICARYSLDVGRDDLARLFSNTLEVNATSKFYDYEFRPEICRLFESAFSVAGLFQRMSKDIPFTESREDEFQNRVLKAVIDLGKLYVRNDSEIQPQDIEMLEAVDRLCFLWAFGTPTEHHHRWDVFGPGEFEWLADTLVKVASSHSTQLLEIVEARIEDLVVRGNNRMSESSVFRLHFAKAVYLVDEDRCKATRQIQALENQAELELTPQQATDYRITLVNSLCAVGAFKLAEEQLVLVHTDSLGYWLAAKKEPQYLFWNESFEAACSTGEAFVRKFGSEYCRFVVGLSDTEGSDTGARICYSLLKETVRAPDLCAGLIDRLWDSGLTNWGKLMGATLHGIATLRNELAPVCFFLYNKMVIPFASESAYSCIGAIHALIPHEQRRQLENDFVECALKFADISKRVELLRSLAKAVDGGNGELQNALSVVEAEFEEFMQEEPNTESSSTEEWERDFEHIHSLNELRKMELRTDKDQGLSDYYFKKRARQLVGQATKEGILDIVERRPKLKEDSNCSPGGSTGYSLSWLRQSTAFPCRAMVVAVSGL